MNNRSIVHEYDPRNKLHLQVDTRRKFCNKSVDEADGFQTHLNNQSFDPFTSVAKLTMSKRPMGNMPRLEPISSPVSPSPTNREHWPRTLKNSKQITSDFNISPKSLIEDYESQRKSGVLSVSKLKAKNKPLSVWDAMALHDVNNFKKECITNELNRKEQQRQLKKFYDKQVQYKKENEEYLKQKATHDFSDLLNECMSIDNQEYTKIKGIKDEVKSTMLNNQIISEAKRQYIERENRLKSIEKAKIVAQIDLIKKLDTKHRREEQESTHKI